MKFSIILSIVSFIILTYCSNNTIASFSREDILGLAGKLNISYWFGLTFIVVSSLLLIFDNKEHKKLFLLVVFILALYLYAIPALVEENIYLADAWGHMSWTISIQIYKNYKQPLSFYARDYPGVFMLQSILILVTRIDPIILTKYHPILFSGLVVLTSYVLLRKLIFNKKMLYLAMIFFITGSVWVFEKHFCPNSFALIWYLLIFYFAFSEVGMKTIGLSIFLTVATIISHPITPLFFILPAILIPTALIISKNLIKLKMGRSLKNFWSRSQIFSMLVLIMWVAWFMFNAVEQFTSLTNMVVRFFESLSEYITLERAAERLSTTPYHVIGQRLKISYTILYIAVSVIGALYLTFEIFKKNRREYIRHFITVISWIVACGIFGIATAFLQGGELFERPILYGFIPLSVLAAFTYRNKYTKIILISILLIGAPLSIFAAYTNEPFEYSPINNSWSSIFMVNHGITEINNVTVGTPTRGVYRFYLYTWILQSDLDPRNLSSSKSKILVRSQVSENFYSFYLKGRKYTELGASALSWLDKYSNLTSQPGFNLMYNNGDFHVWFLR